MSMQLKVIAPDVKGTFGKLIYSGKGKEVYKYDKILRQSTTILEARIYRLTSEVQGGEIEVHVPAEVGELEFNFMDEVEIINPVLTAYGKSEKEKSFAAVVWTCTADTIKKKESGSMPKNTSTARTPA